MRIYKMADYEEMSRKASGILAAQVVMNPRSVLGLATGSTPEGLYRYLVEWNRGGDIDFSAVTTINLDEYIGLPQDHPQSYRRFMRDHLLDHINIDADNTHVPNGMEPDAEKESRRYDAVIAGAGGIDLQLLGIGNNGHIGFNEPGDFFTVTTHAVMLTDNTINANKRFFERESDVPRSAYTMGMRAIMHAKIIVMVVSGAGKAGIVREAFFGPVTPRVPASALQLHRDVILIGDADALSEI